MAAPTSGDDGGVRLDPPVAERPRTLADLQTPLHMSRTGWLIAAMLLVAALSFFILVVLLGVDTS